MDLGIAVVLSHIENGQGSNKVISVSPDVGTEYVQEGTNSVVTLYYDYAARKNYKNYFESIYDSK